MAVTKVVNIQVNDSDVQQATRDANKLADSYDRVEREASQAAEQVDEVAKNGGAIAILDQLTGGLATRVRDAWEATKLFNLSLAGTKKAIIATGIGALVVALGTIIAYWDDITDAIKGVNRELEEQKRIIDGINNSLDSLAFRQQLRLRQIDLETKQQLQRAKAAGASEAELDRIQKEGLQRRIDALEEANQEAQQIVRDTVDADRETYLKAVEEQEKVQGALINARIALADFEAEQIIEARAKAEAERKKLLEERQKEIDSTPNALKRQKGTIEAAQIAADKEIEITRKATVTKLQLEQTLADQRIALAGNVAGSIAQILGENTAAGKAFAIAQALINTYQGVSNVWAEKAESGLVGAGFAQRLAVSAAVLAQGLNTVRQIQSTQLPSFAGGGGFGGGGATQTPSFNVVGTSGTNQLAQVLGQQDNPVQAFVVGNNVTSQQALDRNIVETATIG